MGIINFTKRAISLLTANNTWTGTNTFTSTVSSTGANSQALNIKQLTESTTILAAATTDTTIQIPADSLVLGVTYRVTTVVPTAATVDVGVAGATTRYNPGSGAISTAANTTGKSPGTTNPTIYTAAVSIRFTPDLTPSSATGVIRITIHYVDLTAPSS